MNSNGKQRNSISLAILPFENLTRGNERAILCKSFSMDLITELSRFRQFHIIAPGSLEALDDDKSLQALDTDYHIKGSFRAENKSIRINAQLINSQNSHLVWADRFEGSTDELSEMQDGLLKQVVSNLQQQLNYNLLSQIREKPKVKLRAYEAWLYGMEELRKGSVDNDERAREYFEQTIEQEPHFSLAYSGMSLTYFNEWSCQMWEQWDESQGKAFEWAKKAIELDEQNYVACLVLGRVLMYEGAYETAEHYLRRSLKLNPSDADNILEIASCLTFCGHATEAYELFEKVLKLNPASREHYYPVGVFILFEAGEFLKAKEMALKTQSFPFVDTPAVFAGLFHHLEEFELSEKYWKQYLDTYREKINKGAPCEPLEAISWMIKVNPHKVKSNMEPFWRFKSENKIVTEFPEDQKQVSNASSTNTFLKESDYWKLSFDGFSTRLTEVKGFLDLKKLLGDPGRPIHCAELMGSRINSSSQPIIDEKAKSNYQEKILNLQQDIEVAEEDNDLENLRILQEEYEQLVEHLSASLGLKGKIRQAGNPIEKARSAVTWRIRNAISKIEKAHPSMGKHLSHAVNTGTFCSYDPENNLEWILE